MSILVGGMLRICCHNALVLAFMHLYSIFNLWLSIGSSVQACSLYKQHSLLVALSGCSLCSLGQCAAGPDWVEAGSINTYPSSSYWLYRVQSRAAPLAHLFSGWPITSWACAPVDPSLSCCSAPASFPCFLPMLPHSITLRYPIL